jgi:hypothetical protein
MKELFTMSDNFKIRREAPPEQTSVVGNPTRIDKEVNHMKKNAGVWFKVREAASSGAYIVYKKRGCETRTKTVQGNKYDIWAMWPADDED